MGMLIVPIFVGRIFRDYEGVTAAVRAEWIFIGLGCVAVITAFTLRRVAKEIR